MSLVSRLIGSSIMAATAVVVPIKDSYADPKMIGTDIFGNVNVDTYVDNQRGEAMFVMTPENINEKSSYLNKIQASMFFEGKKVSLEGTTQISYSPDGNYEVREIKPVKERSALERIFYGAGQKGAEQVLNQNIVGQGIVAGAEEFQRRKQEEINAARDKINPNYSVNNVPYFTSINDRETATVIVAKFDAGRTRGKIPMGIYFTWAIETPIDTLPNQSSLIYFDFDNDEAQRYARNLRQNETRRNRQEGDSGKSEDEKKMKEKEDSKAGSLPPAQGAG